MSDSDKVAIVTGANRGIGLALVRQLCKLPFPGAVYLTARNETRGREAIQQLKSEGLNPRFHLLDIGDSNSIKTFVEHLKVTHGGVDVVIANGGIPLHKDLTNDEIEDGLRTNNKGNAELCLTIMPLLRPNARLLIVSSGFGQLKNLGESLRPKFRVTDKLSVADLNKLLDEYVLARRDGTYKEKGWPEWSNAVNKIGLVALARILARKVQDDTARPGILVNAVCPGWTVTEAARPYLDANNKFGDIQAKQPDEAAVDMVWLATLPAGTKEPLGQLVQYRKILSYEV